MFVFIIIIVTIIIITPNEQCHISEGKVAAQMLFLMRQVSNKNDQQYKIIHAYRP